MMYKYYASVDAIPLKETTRIDCYNLTLDIKNYIQNVTFDFHESDGVYNVILSGDTEDPDDLHEYLCDLSMKFDSLFYPGVLELKVISENEYYTQLIPFGDTKESRSKALLIHQLNLLTDDILEIKDIRIKNFLLNAINKTKGMIKN